MPTAAAEWRANWPMVLAAVAGMSVSSLAIYSTGMFMDPLAQEFGWSHADIASGLTIYSVLLIFLSPVAGIMLDRWGSRRIAIGGVLLFTTSFACLGLTTGSIAMWRLLWVLLSAAAPFVTTAVWTSAVSSRFVAGRGLALAVTLSGTSLTQILVPTIANALIRDYGWRGGYLGIGLGWGVVTLVLVLLFFRGARDLGREPGAPVPVAQGGLTLGEALRSVLIWRIALTELVSATLVVATLVHFVPILTSSGIGRDRAAGLATLIGFSAIAGKMLTGWLLDRSQSNWIASVSLWLPAVALLILLDVRALGGWLIVPTLIFGYAVGAYYQTVTYLSTRYAGLRNFGKIFGLMTSLMAIGTGVGPWLAGRIFDVTGDYRLWLIVGAMLSLTAGLLVFRLGPYPIWKADAEGEAHG